MGSRPPWARELKHCWNSKPPRSKPSRPPWARELKLVETFNWVVDCRRAPRGRVN